MLKCIELTKKLNNAKILAEETKTYRPGFVYDKEEDAYYKDIFYGCDHKRKEAHPASGTLFCIKCGLDFGQIIAVGCSPPTRTYKKGGISTRITNYNKTMKKMFPDVVLPNGLKLMNDLEKRFNELEENVGSFPNMKEVIYFILKRCDEQDLANTISLTKSKRSQNILKKLFEDTRSDENTDE